MLSISCAFMSLIWACLEKKLPFGEEIIEAVYSSSFHSAFEHESIYLLNKLLYCSDNFLNMTK